ncbi:TetR family transcriptional regulator C-terminal domain-containing protein [Streptomyces sp. NPDC048295]|uniref:TetR/AcrR family transcriptional regulator n=1 Tax=Streptomyces sp. NPDC048295 TaxID=3154617 RepID=UPI00342AD958
MPRLSVREQLIDAAYDHLHEHGFAGSAVKDITYAAGVPKGSFYNHFDSKEAMATEVMRRYSADQGTEILMDRSMAPLDRIRAHFAYVAARLERYEYARGCLIGNLGAELSSENSTIRDAVDSSLNCWVVRLASALEEARTTGSLTSDVDGVTLARFLVNAWEGAAIRAKISRNRAPVDDFTAVFESLAADAGATHSAVREHAAATTAN